MTINNFRGELTDISVKKEALRESRTQDTTLRIDVADEHPVCC